jgi:hypothetical protein
MFAFSSVNVGFGGLVEVLSLVERETPLILVRLSDYPDHISRLSTL